MDVQQISSFDWDESVEDTMPESLLPPLDGPQETDDCEAEVASDRYAYGGLMKMGRSERSGARPRKRPVLMLDDGERQQALRELDMVAVQDFGEAIPMERPVRIGGLSPFNAATDSPMSAGVVAEPQTMRSRPVPERAAPPLPMPAFEAPAPSFGQTSAPERVSGGIPPRHPGFAEEERLEDDQAFDENAYSSLSGARAEMPAVPEPAPNGPVSDPLPTAEETWSEVAAARAQPFAQPFAQPLTQPAAVEAPVPEAVAPREPVAPAPRPGHALRARVMAEDTPTKGGDSLLGRFFAWLGSLFGR